MMRWLILALPLASCLLLEEKPCNGQDCDNGYACQADGAGCRMECDFSAHCASGYFCTAGACQTCEEAACPGGFSCEENSSKCNEFCVTDDECFDGYTCCTPQDVYDGTCTEDHACYLRP